MVESVTNIFAREAPTPQQLGQQLLEEVRKVTHNKIPDIKNIQSLISAGATLNEKDSRDTTALMWMAIYPLSDIARLLIEAGASLDEIDDTNRTALDWAIFHRHSDIEQLLRDASAERAEATRLCDIDRILCKEGIDITDVVIKPLRPRRKADLKAGGV